MNPIISLPSRKEKYEGKYTKKRQRLYQIETASICCMGTRDVRDTQSIQLKRTLLRKTLKTKEALSLNFEHKQLSVAQHWRICSNFCCPFSILNVASSIGSLFSETVVEFLVPIIERCIYFARRIPFLPPRSLIVHRAFHVTCNVFLSPWKSNQKMIDCWIVVHKWDIVLAQMTEQDPFLSLRPSFSSLRLVSFTSQTSSCLIVFNAFSLPSHILPNPPN